MTRRMRTAGMYAATLGLAALAGCSDTETGESTARTANAGSLVDQLAETEQMQRVSDALNDTGLDGAFSGNGSYTLLAPADAAFAELGEEGEALTGDEAQPAMAALLRDHILVGYLTPSDIAEALERSEEGAVTMRTVGDGTVVFTRSGKAIQVRTPDGAVAVLGGAPIKAGNSIALPVNAVLLADQ